MFKLKDAITIIAQSELMSSETILFKICDYIKRIFYRSDKEKDGKIKEMTRDSCIEVVSSPSLSKSGYKEKVADDFCKTESS